MAAHGLKNSKDPDYFAPMDRVSKQQQSLNHKNFWPRIKIQTTKTKDTSAISTKADILVEGIEITKDDPIWQQYVFLRY